MNRYIANNMASSIAFLVALSLLLVAQAQSQSSNGADAEGDSRTRTYGNKTYTIDTITLAPGLELEVLSGSKKSGKLRLKETVNRYELKSPFYNRKDPLFKMKTTWIEELVECANLNLTRQDQFEKLDCKTLEEHRRNPYVLDEILANTVPDLVSSQGVKFVHSMRLRAKSSCPPVQTKFTKGEIRMLALKPDIIKSGIDAISVDTNFDMNFGETKPRRGYYIELIDWMSPNRTACTGHLYATVNTSNVYPPPEPETWPDAEEDFIYLFDEAIDNGYMVAVRNFQCSSSIVTFFTVETEFIIAQRMTFPYFMLRHKTYTSPLDIFLNYTASITQKLNETHPNEPGAYTTNVDIISRDALFQILNFNLHQTFDNINSSYGLEDMTYISANHVLKVVANWSEKQFRKTFLLWQSANVLKSNLADSYIKPSAVFSYVDDKDLDNLLYLTLGLAKSLFVTDDKAKQSSSTQTVEQPDPSQQSLLSGNGEIKIHHAPNMTRPLDDIIDSITNRHLQLARNEL